MALAQLQAGNTFKKLLNEICQIHSLYQAKEITINYHECNKFTEDNLLPYRLLLILEDKINLK